MSQLVDMAEIDQYIGQAREPSDWITIDQDRVNAFADATLDHQFIHLDEEAAAKTPFGGTIAHGFLSLSLLPYFGEQCGIAPKGTVMAINYGSDKVRFLTPVRVGSRIRCHQVLDEAVEKNPGQYLFKSTCTIEIEGVDKPALIAQTLSMIVTQG